MGRGELQEGLSDLFATISDRMLIYGIQIPLK